MKNDDRSYVKERLESVSGPVPASLRPENVTRLVAGRQQQSTARRRAYLPMILSAAAALILLVGVGTAVHFIGNKNAADTSGSTYAENVRSVSPMASNSDYARIGALLGQTRARNGESQYAGYVKGVKSEVIEGFDEDFAEDYPADAALPNEAAAPNGAEPSAAPQTEDSSDYSRLNTRTEDVDETDIIRTDGKHIYVLSGTSPFKMWSYSDDGRENGAQTFTVIDPNNGNMRVESTVTLSQTGAGDGCERYYDGFFLHGNYVVFTGYENRYTEGEPIPYDDYIPGYDDGFADSEYADSDYAYSGYTAVPEESYITPTYVETTALAVILDISDPNAPKQVKELRFDSDMIGARIAGDRLITVSVYYPLYGYGFNVDDYKTYIPRAGEDYAAPQNIVIADEDGEAFFTVSVTDLSDRALPCRSVSVLGVAEEMYCTADTVYAYGETYNYSPKGTSNRLELYKVDVSGTTPAMLSQAGFDGVTLRDDYAIDEYDGYVRLALEGWSALNAENYILVLDGDLKAVGLSEVFGTGENIQAVRFAGDKAYVVTFLNTDPFFVIDLSDPAKPVIQSELKLPGYSAYLHPAGEGYMIGVGSDGDNNGLNGDGKISLFSVADPENPVEVDRLVLADGWFDTDPKAYVAYGDNGCIVVYERWKNIGYGSTRFVHGAYCLTVENGKLNVVAHIETDLESESIRALYIGNVLYLYSTSCWRDADARSFVEDVLHAFDLTTGKAISGLTLRSEIIEHEDPYAPDEYYDGPYEDEAPYEDHGPYEDEAPYEDDAPYEEDVTGAPYESPVFEDAPPEPDEP